MQNTIKRPTIGWGTVLVALLATASPAGASIERVPAIDPHTTSCAAYVNQLRHSSIGRFVFAVNLRPVTAHSPVTAEPGDAQYVRLADAPIEIKRELLRALTDLGHGGSGDPRGISQSEDTRISRLFQTSVEADLQTAVEALGNTPPKN
ncbi:hypothetical protein HB780_14570 [Rhizobium lusitanum]|uniref:hypothetical protein n=1 Tax=Rhizobium lusitanum TaxID=293958 RepID=UPI001619CE91|nr:hypothetical protein [Rhizobium lusitanum]QND46960.1 hypothetical protein HB780_14570 [Rhizobium lusitanum]